MGPIDLLIHLASFAAPALFVAALLALLGQFLVPKPAKPRVLACFIAINFVAGLLVLLAGLWWFGNDGKMATYAALVAVMATSQWLASRAWRG